MKHRLSVSLPGLALGITLAIAPTSSAFAQSFSFASQLNEGGLAIVVMLGMSVIAVWVTIERLRNELARI